MSAWKKQTNADAYVDGVRAAIPLIEAQIDLAHRLLDATLTKIEHILDLGCGDGALAASVLSKHPNASAVLVDFSEPMLARAIQRFEGRDAAVSVVQADFGAPGWTTALPQGRSYELVISGYAIHHLDDVHKQVLFREVFDCLSPGGMFLNLEHVASMTALGRNLFDEIFIDNLYNQALQHDPNIVRSDVAAGYHQREDQHDNCLAPVERQCQWLRDVGFVDVDCYFKVLELALIAGRKPD